MAAVMGLASGLARSQVPDTDGEFSTRAALLLGYDLPCTPGLRA